MNYNLIKELTLEQNKTSNMFDLIKDQFISLI